VQLAFPPVTDADENGLIGIGGDFSLVNLLSAYSQGIFPWPISQEYPTAWFSPDPRGVLFTRDLKIPRSLKRFMNKKPYDIRFNTNFTDVIRYCSKVPRSDNTGTWITQELIDAYQNLFDNGYAYSVEVYDNGTLVGGLYGVCIGGFVSGESMFYLKDNASKVALVMLIEKLKKSEISFLDTQMVTPITMSLGAKEIARESFIKILDTKKPLNREAIFN
jgi:leucyl/phenylalanyl-tRNA--protein transferase